MIEQLALFCGDTVRYEYVRAHTRIVWVDGRFDRRAIPGYWRRVFS